LSYPFLLKAVLGNYLRKNHLHFTHKCSRPFWVKADFIDFYADLSEEEVIRYSDSYLSEKGEVMGLVSALKEEGRIATLFHVQNTQRRMGGNYVVSKAVR